MNHFALKTPERPLYFRSCVCVWGGGGTVGQMHLPPCPHLGAAQLGTRNRYLSSSSFESTAFKN